MRDAAGFRGGEACVSVSVSVSVSVCICVRMSVCVCACACAAAAVAAEGVRDAARFRGSEARKQSHLIDRIECATLGLRV